MENILANALDIHGGGRLVTSPYRSEMAAFQENPEVLAKLRAEKEEAEKLYRQRQIVGAKIAIAERLVIERGETPEIALKIADDLTNRCQALVTA
jgi:hypothetical protein